MDRPEASLAGLCRVAAGEGDELVEGAGVGRHRYGRIKSGSGATLRIQGLPREAEDISGVGVRDVDGTFKRYGEVPAVDHQFETQDAKRKVGGQRSPAEHDIVGQSAAAPACQDRLRNLLYALVDGNTVGDCGFGGFDARGGPKARDRVDEMLCEGLHIPVATGSRTVQVVWPDRLDDLVHDGQCLLGTGKFVHGTLLLRLVRRIVGIPVGARRVMQ